MSAPPVTTPSWHAPRVRSLMTDREGGVSTGVFAGLNLGAHVGDDPAAVLENRHRLRARVPAEPLWLSQVHGVAVVDADAVGDGREAPTGDAAVARGPGRVLAIQVADCLPVLLADRAGRAVAAAHAGWRGLAGGVLEATVAALGIAPSALEAWIGPGISAAHFEVGQEVREAFCANDPAAAAAFTPNAAGRWQCDLLHLARQRLARLGVTHVSADGRCTWRDPGLYSFRRDRTTGRMAALIWLEGKGERC